MIFFCATSLNHASHRRLFPGHMSSKFVSAALFRASILRSKPDKSGVGLCTSVAGVRPSTQLFMYAGMLRRGANTSVFSVSVEYAYDCCSDALSSDLRVKICVRSNIHINTDYLYKHIICCNISTYSSPPVYSLEGCLLATLDAAVAMASAIKVSVETSGM